MTELSTSPQPDAQDNVWIEIIRQMETIYAELAEAQAQVEERARELGEAKELADNIIGSMNDGLVVLDAEGRIARVNLATVRLFGVPEEDLIGSSLDRLLPPAALQEWPWRRLFAEVRRAGRLTEVETTWCDAAGNPIDCGVSGAALRDRWGDVIGAVFVVRDLREAKRRIAQARAATRAARSKARELEQANAELKQLQAELVQAAKMSSLGRLAAGVAHELNNPLGSILLYSDLVLEDTPPDDPRRANLAKIAHEATRCRRIVRGLLDFGRAPEGTAAPVDVNAVLAAALDVLAGQEMFHNVEVDWRLAEELPVVLGDAGQLQQAFTNLVLNAVEAMEGRGRLTLATTACPAGDGVVVTVSDTGCGIPAENLEHLFEPFFTTREDGTGLGLAITYGIVERHGGSIEVSSKPGEGTSFRVTVRSMKEAQGDG